jgi:glucan 1,4-alpha-glucosidase
MRSKRRSVALFLSAPLALLLAASPLSVRAESAAATGAPGALSHFDLARKDCLGTARNTTSKIWYTVAGGVLSDVYAPTIDTTQVETMQFIVTDGATFTDLQARDTTYAVSADPTGMVCTVTSTARSGAYRITVTYLTDPAHDSVVVWLQYAPVLPAARSYRVYVRLDATVGGNGGGGSGNGGADSAVIDLSTGQPVLVSFDPQTSTNASNRDYAVPSYLALRADRPFTAASSGFVGTASDGLQQLDRLHDLSPAYASASGGNVEQTAGLNLGPRREALLVLGFGRSQAEAVATAGASLARGFKAMLRDYQEGWLDYDASLRPPPTRILGLSPAQAALVSRTYQVSANVLKASEDKTFPGAIVASLASPWGQAVSAGDPAHTYFGSYREVFSRDLYQAWTGLFTAGDLATARATVRFLFLKQQLDDGSFPRNSLLNGKTAPDSFGVQLDEVAYPILMVDQSELGGDDDLWPHVAKAANFLVSHGPAFGVERWEEQGGYSPSTIAAEIAGLVSAARIALQHGDEASARVWLATADRYQRSVKDWTLTLTGPLSSSPYFLRLSKAGDPNAAVSYDLGNGGPTLDQRTVIDAGFLELVRLGALPARDFDVSSSLAVVDTSIRRQTPNGAGWLRYGGDGYGDCLAGGETSCTTTGAPWAPTGKGTGHVWPVLAAERAEQDLAEGNFAAAAQIAANLAAQASGVGLIAEQVWDAADLSPSPFGADPTVASIGFTAGKPTGSAAPLTWGAAAFVRLVADLDARRVLERPAAGERYRRGSRSAAALQVSSPEDLTPAGSSVAVTGTAEPGATVDVALVAVDAGGAAKTSTATAKGDGTFSLSVTPSAGANVLVVAATTVGGATAQVTRTVVQDVVEGTLLFQASDPDGDDAGAGTYAYPTAADFHPGAFDLEQFQVFDTGDTVTFRVRTRDLTPTFGNPLGAQLLDVYVHEPSAAPFDTSTAASFPQRNYTIAPAQAWTRLIEAQGFGQRFVDAHGATKGQVTIKASPISRYITFSVSKSALGGTPTTGWAFTVALTGQDGYSADQARGFTAVPGAYTFGVCPAAASDARCAIDPGTVPKVMDTIPPLGVSKSDELDTTRPAVLRGLVMP